MLGVGLRDIFRSSCNLALYRDPNTTKSVPLAIFARSSLEKAQGVLHFGRIAGAYKEMFYV